MSVPLEAKGLRVGYGAKVVVDAFDLELNPGEAIALLGPNGGGKSTLLKTLAGLHPALGGSVFLAGKDLGSLGAREIAREIGFVPQEESWRFEFTVEEVVAMGRLPISNGFFDTAEDHEEAKAAMDRAGCLALRHRPVTELSGGERQRVMIARALAQHTPIIFLDEPTAHLDPQYQVGAASLVRQLVAEGKSIILAIHDLPIAATMADRAVLVSGGRATPPRKTIELLESEELDSAYQTRFRRIQTDEGLVVLPAMN